MPDLAQLKYNTSLTVDLQVLAVHGASEPDRVSRFGKTHEMLDASVKEMIQGGRREISIDFQTMTAAQRRKCVLWWLDPDRQLVCLMVVVEDLGHAPSSGGSLLEQEYDYKVTAVDVIGEGRACTAISHTIVAPNQTLTLSWTAVADARRYKIYRSDDAAVTWDLLDYSETNSYVDDGTVTPLKEEVTPPAEATHIHVVTTNDVLEFIWGYETELNRLLSIELREATIFTRTEQFPI